MRLLISRGLRLFAALLLSISVPGFAQYPPGQYPPGQYPPGQYPPGQYPQGQYPNTLPGGIPMPSIHLPKRKSKAEDSGSGTSKITLAQVEGSLRKLNEKDLLLQTSPSRILRFRLIAKTEFRGKDAKPIRDSLLHPGDHLTIEVAPDDPETAVHVILARSGSKSERETAESPVEQASISSPEAGDLGKTHTAVVKDTATADPPSDSPVSPSSSSSTLERETPADSSSAPSVSAMNDMVINDARDAASIFTAGLPNFLVEQVTTRYQGSPPNSWRAMDVVTADVASVDGKEDYRNIRVNGRPSQGAVEDSGSWSTGEFTVTLQDVLSISTNAAFRRRGEDVIAGRAAIVYDLSVDQRNSHWTLVSMEKRQYNPAYKGAIWIDKETNRVMRIEQKALSMPRDFTFDRAESAIEYGFVTIEGKRYLLPIHGENMACMAGTRNCSRNAIDYRNYRKFAADSNIVFKFSGQ